MYIYILLLEANKYYIGKTDNPTFRIDNHFKNNGSEWTKKYAPLSIIEIIGNCDAFDEDKYTLKYMVKYGITNVRGGSYSNINLYDWQTKNIERQIRTISNTCYNCGYHGHYIKKCPLNEKKIISNTDPANILKIINIYYGIYNIYHIDLYNKKLYYYQASEKLPIQQDISDIDAINKELLKRNEAYKLYNNDYIAFYIVPKVKEKFNIKHFDNIKEMLLQNFNI